MISVVEPPVVIHRAPWVIPVSSEPLQDGAVAVSCGKIYEVAAFSDVQQVFPSATVRDYSGHALLPGLVNAHTHFELSHLSYLSRKPAPSSFTGWIEQLLTEREKQVFTREEVEQAAHEALAEQQKEGVIAIADITNTGILRQFTADFYGILLCFKEFYGLNTSGVEATCRALAAEQDTLCTAHAPYSTHIKILQAIQLRAKHLGHVFPLHVAESAAETEMVSQGRGEIPDFLAHRGFWDNSFQPTGIDNSGSVQYLHQSGLLDDNTLCVHAVHVTERECTLLQRAGSSVCLCPGSNRYLGVGKAPVARYLQLGITLALGTDSLTSNPEISLWREMRLLKEENPQLQAADILCMATLGGSKALRLDHDIGSLDKGKRASFLAVELDGTEKTGQDVMENLVSGVNKPKLSLIGINADVFTGLTEKEI